MNKPINDLILFIKTNENWRELLSSAPYHIKIKEDPDNKNYFMLSYNAIKTDFSQNLTRACRGIVLHIEWPKINVVSYAFDKFFNLCERYAWTPDWINDKIVCSEKIDGSLIKFSVYNGNKFWFTNNGFVSNCVNQCQIVDSPEFKTWMDLIDYSLNGRTLDSDFTDKTLMFELTSPVNRVVIKYNNYDLRLLGMRDNKTFKEYTFEDSQKLYAELTQFKTPKVFSRNLLYSRKKVQDMVESITNNEGFVLYSEQDEIKRVKVKCLDYLTKHHIKDSSGRITYKLIFDSMRLGNIDDIIGNFEEYSEACHNTIKQWKYLELKLNEMICECQTEFLGISGDYSERKKKYAEYVKNNYVGFSSCLFLVSKYPNLKIHEIRNMFLKNVDYEKFVKLLEVVDQQEN